MSKIAFLLGLVLPGVAAAQTLPANVEVPVTLVQEVSSQRMKAGATFDVAVARDVWVDGRVAIPRGTRGRGAVTWRTGRGAFGKSGKMEIEVRSLDMGGVAVPLTGKYREEGQGNTGATIGTIVVAGLVGGAFVTGRSAVFEEGRELIAFTTRPVSLDAAPPVIAAPVPIMAAVVPAVSATPVAPVPVMATVIPVPVVPVAAPVATLPVVAVVAPPAPAPRVTAAFVPLPQSATVAAAAPTYVSGPSPENLRAEAEDARYRALMTAQQGVRGRSGQGWTISD